jgi:hypothetical protein
MIERETVRRGENVSFYFDPICPWTWITSRWLVEVADQRRLRVDWRAMSLVALNGGASSLNAARSGAARLSTGFLRMIEAMRSNGRADLIGPFYTAVGNRLHVEGEQPTMDLLEEAARETGVIGFLVAAEDSHWNEAVLRSTAEAMELGGPDTGSPILRIEGQEHGTHGPIVSPAPRGDDALRLWDVVSVALEIPGFYEIKHGRDSAPEITREPAAYAESW